MNYLGHLYLSKNQPELMLANIFGDFVKGRDYTHLPVIIQKGVTLHREIDDFIDTHPLILKVLNDYLYAELPKVAPIAVDLYMDHLLAKYWTKYHELDLISFERTFFDFALNSANQSFENGSRKFSYPKEFIELLNIMHKKSWLSQYEKLEGLQMASTGLSKRISFENNLNEAVFVFKKHENVLQKVFLQFIEDARIKFLV